MSCDGISIDQFSLLFSSLSMPLLVFHLEYHFIVLWLMRLTNCLKMGWNLRPKRPENTWFSRKIKKSCTSLHLFDLKAGKIELCLSIELCLWISTWLNIGWAFMRCSYEDSSCMILVIFRQPVDGMVIICFYH